MNTNHYTKNAQLMNIINDEECQVESDEDEGRVDDEFDTETKGDMRHNIKRMKRGQNNSKMAEEAISNSQKKRRGGLADYNQSKIASNPEAIRESIAEKLSQQQSPNGSPYNDFAGVNALRNSHKR